MTHTLEQVLATQLNQWKFPPTRLLVGLSGGVDSSALLLACHNLATRGEIVQPIVALHAQHGLHQDDADWRNHCATLCTQLGIELISQSLSLPSHGNLEANAREARYEFFAQHVGVADLLLLAHHEQDQLETLLQRLFSGRGLIAMRNSGSVGDGHFLRPLMDLGRETLQQYLLGHGVTWVEDPSNLDDRFQRNFVRHSILPLLEGRWPNLAQRVQRVAQSSNAVQAALSATLQTAAANNGRLPLSMMPTNKFAGVAWLRTVCHLFGQYSPSDRALQEFHQQLSGANQGMLRLSDHACLRGYQQELWFVADVTPEQIAATPVQLGQKLRLAYGTLSIVAASQGAADTIRLNGPLVMKFAQGGERIRSGGLSKAVSRLFQEARIPPWQRPHYPLLYLQDTLACVPALATAEQFVPTRGDVMSQPLVALEWLEHDPVKPGL